MIYLTADITELPRALYIRLTLTERAAFIKKGGVIFTGKSADNEVVHLRTSVPLQAHQIVALRDTIAKITLDATAVSVDGIGLKVFYRPSVALAANKNSSHYAPA